MYSPAAMEIVPAKLPAKPEIKMAKGFCVAAATPITIPATEIMPSFAPITLARKIFTFCANDIFCFINFALFSLESF